LNGSALLAGRTVLKEGCLISEYQEIVAVPGLFEPNGDSTTRCDKRAWGELVIAVVAGVLDESRDTGPIDTVTEGLDISGAGRG
jgi:hypothetical protein